MDQLVFTNEGLVPRRELYVRFLQEEQQDGSGIMLSVLWYRDGREVRRDGWLNLYKGFEVKDVRQ